MKKNKAIVTLIVTLLVILGLGYTAVWGIGSEKAGAASEIKLGLDLAGGVSITYQVVGDEEPSSEDMSDTIYKLQKRVEVYSPEAQVYQEGADRINIEIPGVSDANTILEDLGRPGALYFIAQTDSEGNQNYSYTGAGQTGYTLNKPLDERGNRGYGHRDGAGRLGAGLSWQQPVCRRPYIYAGRHEKICRRYDKGIQRRRKQ